jgi:hypothetical protein
MATDSQRFRIAERVDGDAPPTDPLLAQLRADRDALARLPRLDPPPGFADRVMAGLPVVVTRPPRPADRWAWVPHIVAASLLVSVAGVAALLLPRQAGRPSVRVAEQSYSPTQPSERAPELAPPPRPVRSAVARVKPKVELAPRPRPVEPLLSAAELLPDIAAPSDVVVRVSPLVPASDLGAAAVQVFVAEEWPRLSAARLDLFAPDVPAAVTRLKAEAAAAGIAPTVEPATAERLKQKLPLAYGLYVDGLTAEEANKLLARLAGKPDRPNPFGTAHLSALGPADGRDWRDLFEPKRANREPADAPPTDKRPGFLFTFTPAARPPLAGRDLRTFLDGRGERKPTARPLLVVACPADGG